MAEVKLPDPKEWHERDYARRFVCGELPIPYLHMQEFVEAAVSVAILFAEHVEPIIQCETLRAAAQLAWEMQHREGRSEIGNAISGMAEEIR